MEPLAVQQSTQVAPRLPVAAFPEYQGEVRLIVRGKCRPALVLSLNRSELEAGLQLSKAPWQTAPAMLVAPYYGVSQSKRAGWDPLLVERIRRCRYSQYVWDQLPVDPSTASILRLDHVQGLPVQPHAYKDTGFRLGAEALELVLEWYQWFLFGVIAPDSLLALLREGLYSPEQEETEGAPAS